MPGKKCVLFDIDGTLMDTEEAIVESLKSTMKKLYSKDYSDEELYFAVALPSKDVLTTLGVKDVDNALRYWVEQLKAFYHRVRIYPQIKETIQTLKDKKIKLGIVTARYDFEVEEDLVLKELLHYFDVVITYDEILRPKPHPDQLLKALEKLDAEPGDALYVGDTIIDYECAKSANVDFVLANWGRVDRKSNFKDNVKICNNPAELLTNIMN
ncbi:MAG: HAD family hydrolase [Bacillota bacterium]